MPNITELVKMEIEGVFAGQLERISKINRWYEIYDGDQYWETSTGLDYEPTKRITNHIRRIIKKLARFEFGKPLFFDFNAIDAQHEEKSEEKERLLAKILRENKFDAKIIKARRDCSIGGRIAIKIWSDAAEGIRIIFSPAQEFITEYDTDDIDKLTKVVFFYGTDDGYIRKQKWELIDGECVLNEGVYTEEGELVGEADYVDHRNELDFIPVVIVSNGGLTGETEGESDVQAIWSLQDSYNKMTSDDEDALKFQMFGQTVITDGDPLSISQITIAPSALVDLKTDHGSANQAKYGRLDSSFNYAEKYKESIDRIKTDMYDLMDMPETSTEKLRGYAASGKTMEAVYWDLMSRCDESWAEWEPALQQMVDYIFRMIEKWDLYKGRHLATTPTDLTIHRSYPIQRDELAERESDRQDVQANVMSRKEYIKKWGIEDAETELKQIYEEKTQLERDTYGFRTFGLEDQGGGEPDGEEGNQAPMGFV